MQNCSSGLRTLVAFGEKFIRDDAASKHSQVQAFTWEESHGCAAGGFVSRVSPVHASQFSPWNGLTGDITPHMHVQRQVGILLRPLMTGTQPHNVWTYSPPSECPTWNRSSYFNFLFFVVWNTLSSNIYQNSHQGNNRHFHSPILTTKTETLNMIFFSFVMRQFSTISLC